jgi:acetoin utilization protein AcuC
MSNTGSKKASIGTPESSVCELVLVHSDEYADWKFSDTSPTQGRRCVNARNLIAREISFDNPREAVQLAPRLATREELALVHDQKYISEVLDEHVSGEWYGPRPDLARLAQLMAGGTLVALEELLSGRTKVAVNLAGAKHHAQFDYSAGFCVFADFAMAAKVAVSRGLKVAIFDFDAHHGDGTENLCADDPNILTFSIHQRGIYPGTGLKDVPAKHIYNRPINVGDYQSVWDGDVKLIDAFQEFGRKAQEFGADILFVAAGADGHRDDPLSSLDYTHVGVQKGIAAILHGMELDIPVLVGGAGGYNPDTSTPQMWAVTVLMFVNRFFGIWDWQHDAN